MAVAAQLAIAASTMRPAMSSPSSTPTICGRRTSSRIKWRCYARRSRESFCFTAVEQVNEYGEKHILPQARTVAGESLADYMLKSGNIMQTSTLLVPRHLLAKCRFNEKLRRFQDLDFVLTLGEAGVGAVFCQQPLVEWRNVGNPKRVSSNPDPAIMRTFLSQHPRLTMSQRLGLGDSQCRARARRRRRAALVMATGVVCVSPARWPCRTQ